MKLFVWFGLTALTMALSASGQGRANSVSSAPAERQADAPFASEIAAFEAADKKNPPPSEGIVFVGSSSIRFWTTLAQDFPGLPVINRGFGGSEIADNVRYADRIVFPYKPKMIVLYAGGNDLNAGKSPAQVLKDFQAFADKTRAALPETRLVYISINPSVARWSQEEKVVEANRLIQRFIHKAPANGQKLSYLDSHSRLLNAERKPRPDILRADGLHLNTKGYEAWTAIVNPQIVALWQTDRK